jgi:hypothetical protein
LVRFTSIIRLVLNYLVCDHKYIEQLHAGHILEFEYVWSL